MEKKLTDEEIVKAFDLCINEGLGCGGCPYCKEVRGDTGYCEGDIEAEVLDLIHRLQRQHKRLKKQLKSLQEDMKLEVGIRNKEIERLNKENDQLVIEKRIIKDQKYEALQKLDEMTNKCNEIYWFKHYEQAVKDTAREILQELYDQIDENTPKWVGVQIKIIAKRKGVEVE